MAFNYPEDRKVVADRQKTDVQGELPESNPFLPNSFMGAEITGSAGRNFDFYMQLKVLDSQLFVNTATGVYLEMFAGWKGISRSPATQATGNVTATGTPGNSIPDSTTLATSDGLQYNTVGSAIIASNVVGITSLTRSGTTAIAVTASDHNLASGMSPVIAGANETEYNGTVAITVTALNSFTYEVLGSPASPATGTITVTSDSATVSIESVDFGQDTNQDAGAEITFSSPLAGIDNITRVQFSAIGGGTDLQSDDDLRIETIEAYANPVSTFNVAAIVKQAKEIAGVTRVFVQEITPAVGDVTIYFTRDNDDNIIPDAGEVTTVKDRILGIKPANTAEADVIVAAPTGVPVPFTFSSISPNTTTMQAAVTANLGAYFRDDTIVGENLLKVAYDSIIFQTVDPDTGAGITSFTLSTPTGDVVMASDELPTLGNVNYP